MVDAKGCTMTGVVDSDGDGVLDSVDACPGTTVGMVVDATGCLVEQSVTLRGINFDTGSARLTSDSRVALDSRRGAKGAVIASAAPARGEGRTNSRRPRMTTRRAY
jgi:hypothetical protein